MRELTPKEKEEARMACLTHEQYLRLKDGSYSFKPAQKIVSYGPFGFSVRKVNPDEQS